jgi:peptidylamidoglycolate lyase
MNLQKAFGLVNAWGSDAFIGSTQLLSRLGWLRTPGESADTVGQGRFRYRVVRDWCKADPGKVPIRNCHEMVIDRLGRLYLLTDHPRNNVIVLGGDGQVVKHWTLNSKSAHGLTLHDHHGQECLWICDPYDAKVVCTSLDGQVMKTLPGPHALGIYSFAMPYAPTQTAIAPNGDVYVADGYGSQHVLQFDASGRYVRQFGGRGRRPQHLDFAHGIAIDPRRGRGHEILLVTSRRESRIKQFSLDGDYLGSIELPGGFPCRPVIHGQNLLVSLCWSQAHLKANTGFIVVLDENNRLLASLGGDAETDEHGVLRRLKPTYACFRHVHDVCPDSQGNLYVCQWNAAHTYPIKLVPTGAAAAPTGA